MKKFTGREKLDLVLQYHVLSTKRGAFETIKAFERGVGVKRQVIHGWRQILFDRAEETFSHGAKLRTLAERCDSLEKKNQDLERKLEEYEGSVDFE